jgi:hypothetical protein
MRGFATANEAAESAWYELRVRLVIEDMPKEKIRDALLRRGCPNVLVPMLKDELRRRGEVVPPGRLG